MTPKSLLRYKLAVSSVTDLAEGTFCEVIDDPSLPDPKRITRICFCSGKVYYDLLAEQERRQSTGAAIVRIEQLYPLPYKALTTILERYPKVRDIAWVQEEPRNMGAWSFMLEHLSALAPAGVSLRYIGRVAQASPAVGAQKIHQQEQAQLVEQALTTE
jgi:2-oxoglutarate dehydrogenase E1 component